MRSLQPLIAGDPESIDRWRLVGRIGAGQGFAAFRGIADDGDADVLAFRLADPAAQPAGIPLAGLPADLPCVAPILGTGVFDGWVWLASRAADGDALATEVEASGALDDAAWDRLALDTLTALAAIHGAGMVHGRLVPDAVLVSPAGAEVSHVGLLALAEASGQPGVGAPPVAWMAPEVIAGNPVDARSDIFILGCLLAFAGTGRQPWGPNSTPTALLVERITTGDADLGGLTEARRRIVVPMLRLIPGDRPTAAEALQALATREVALPVLPVAPPVGSVTESGAGTGGSRRPLILAAAAVAVLLVVAGAVFALTRGSGSGDTTADSSATAPPSASAAASPGASGGASASATPSAAPRTSVRVNYRSSAVPDKIYRDTLDWVFDVCSSDPAMKEAKTVAAIRLFRKENGKWVRQSVTPEATAGGRCGGKRTNILISETAPADAAAEVGAGWGECLDYRVVLPETRTYTKTNVDFCVQVKADAA